MIDTIFAVHLRDYLKESLHGPRLSYTSLIEDTIAAYNWSKRPIFQDLL